MQYKLGNYMFRQSKNHASPGGMNFQLYFPQLLFEFGEASYENFNIPVFSLHEFREN
jgi:hypothetical protein